MDTSTLEPALRDTIAALQQRLQEQLPAHDPHGRLAGRPMTIQPIDKQTVEVVYHEVPQITETEVRAFRRLVDFPVFCTVMPESERTLIVTF
ncbi:MAG TPA: hypothetical protein VJ672_15670, partial [Gemmatimonadaceae bacterium]|nr:hypothetical protein [Gemmatimonadaceae bacterium]